MICIYQLNFTEGTYIGKTTNLRVRLARHFSMDSCGQKLKDAWANQTYIGYVVLEECSVEELSAKEVYWIAKRNPSLNTLPGGETLSGLNHPRNKCTKEEVEEIVRLLELGFRCSVIAEQLNLPYGRVYDICVGKAHVWATQHLNLEELRFRNGVQFVVYDEHNIEHVITYGNREDFCISHGMPRSALNTVSAKANKYGYSTERHKEYLVTSPYEEGKKIINHFQLQKLVKEEKSAAYLFDRLTKGKESKGWKAELLPAEEI